jgi:hypothetical protein
LLATYYRTALLLGLVRGDDVHRWVERVIEQEPDPPKAFFEIASVAADDLSGLRHALWPLVIEPDPAAVIETIFGLLHADLVGERRTFDDTLTILRQMRSLLRLPPDLYADMNATLVTYATSQQRQVVVEWLQRFARSRIEQL